MAKPLKIILLVLGVLLALLLIAATVLTQLFDPNQFRGQISARVGDKTGRPLVLGDISLKVFPWLRVDVADAKLGNAPGFGDEPFAQVRRLGVGVKLLPLLQGGQIEISDLVLDGLVLNLAVDAQGRNNWQDLAESDDKSKEEKQPDDAGEAFDPSRLDIGGMRITDAALRYSDARSAAKYRIEPFNLKTGALRIGQPFDVEMSLQAFDDAQKSSAAIELSTRVTPDADKQLYSLGDLVLEVNGKLVPQKLSVDGTLKAQVIADLAAKQFKVDGIDLQARAAGESIPGGEQSLSLKTALSFDQAKGQLQLNDVRVQAAGMSIATTLHGEGLNGDAPSISGPLSIAPFSPRELLKTLKIDVETADAKALSQASLNGELNAGKFSARLENLKLVLDDTTLSGRLAVRDFATQALEFTLKANALDADRYLPPKADKPDKSGADKRDINAIELPTAALDKLNATGTLDVGRLKLNGLSMTDTRLTLSGGRAPRVQQLTAKLYGGSLNLAHRYEPGESQPVLALKTDLTALDAAPFLQDLLGKDYLSGLGTLHLDLSSRGRTVGDLRQALNGVVSFDVRNGAVKGFNLGQILRQGQALLAGQPLAATAADANVAKETDFASFSASGKIVDGVLSSDDLAAASPAFRMSGSGKIDLVKETLQYVARPTVVESSEGQGGKGLEQLKGLTIPIRLSGSLFAPKYKLDLDNVVKEKAKAEAEKVIRDKLGIPADEGASKQELKQQLNDQLNEKLGDLLFGKKKKSAVGQSAPQTQPESAPAAEEPAAPADAGT